MDKEKFLKLCKDNGVEIGDLPVFPSREIIKDDKRC